MPTNRIQPSPVTCPICRRRFDAIASRTMPFCSPRCRLIDLGRWLGEEYGVPAPQGETDEAEDVSDDS